MSYGRGRLKYHFQEAIQSQIRRQSIKLYVLGLSGKRFRSISTWWIVHCMFSNFCTMSPTYETWKRKKKKKNRRRKLKWWVFYIIIFLRFYDHKQRKFQKQTEYKYLRELNRSWLTYLFVYKYLVVNEKPLTEVF